MAKSSKQVASSSSKSAKAQAKKAVTKALTGKARATRTPKDGTIQLLVKANPYRPNSNRGKTFAMLKNGMQVAAYHALTMPGKYSAGGALRRMAKAGLISIKG